MKINRKITIITAALLSVTPIISSVSNLNKVVEAADVKNTIKLTSSTGSIIVYDHAGNFNSKFRKKLKKGTSLKYNGKTVYVNQKKFAAGIPVPTSRIVSGQLLYSIGHGGYVKESDVLTWIGNTNIVTLHFRHSKNYIYNKNGKRLTSYQGGKNYYTKQERPKIYVPYYNSPKQLFSIGNGGYIDASQIATLNGQGTLFLNNNTYVYDATGKRLGNDVLKQGTIINYYGKTKKATVNAKFYYYNKKNKDKRMLDTIQVGNNTYIPIASNKYINAKNVALVNGHLLWYKGPVEIKLLNDVYAYTSKLRQNKKKFIGQRPSSMSIRLKY